MEIYFKTIKFYQPNIIYFNNYNLLNKKLLSEIRKLNHVKLLIAFHCSPLNIQIIKSLG